MQPMNGRFQLKTLIILLILASFISLGNPIETAGAHPLNNGYSQLTVEQNGVGYELFIPEISLLKYDANKDGTLSAEEITAHASELTQELSTKIRLEQSMEPMEFRLRAMEKTEKETIPGVSFSLFYTARQPVTGFTVNYSMLFDSEDLNHLNFMLILEGDDVDQTIFDSAHRSYHFESLHPAGRLSTLWKYFVLGIEHIIKGYDHLLFLFSLILVASRYKDVIKIVTAFTVAHSITLLLAALGRINPNPAWVESAIALSICYVAAENIWNRGYKLRWALTFVFGLIHGMGFASALKEIGLPKQIFIGSLLSFNVGVEIGQLAVVCLFLPLLLLCHNIEKKLVPHRGMLRKQAWHRTVVVAASAVIFIIAFWWLLDRMGILPEGG